VFISLLELFLLKQYNLSILVIHGFSLIPKLQNTVLINSFMVFCTAKIMSAETGNVNAMEC